MEKIAASLPVHIAEHNTFPCLSLKEKALCPKLTFNLGMACVFCMIKHFVHSKATLCPMIPSWAVLVLGLFGDIAPSHPLISGI